MSANDKLWGGRFTLPMDRFTEEFTASIGYDRKLLPYDIRGSVAHARMLAEVGVLSRAEADLIVEGLEAIAEDFAQGRLEFRVDLEDIHMNIEKRLIERIGPVGGKLHTGRSRNDQVALDIRLYCRDALDQVMHFLRELQRSLIAQAREHTQTLMPGYTHLQTAQPVLLAHHLLAYFEMFERDFERFAQVRERVNILPLGAGALAGTTFPIDREFVARELGFAGVTRNSLDTVSDRDAIVEICAAASLCMMHLSRISEELVLWSSSEFRFVELSDAYCTGSSIMPQKKNPDVCELVRGKTGRVYGNLMALLTVLKSLPLAYNKDMQEDKEPLFDTMDTLIGSLRIYADMIRTARFIPERMAAVAGMGFSTATDLADYLVRKGMPFRDAHEVVGRIVAHAERNGMGLEDFGPDELRSFSDMIDEDLAAALTVEASVNARTSYGGTARERVLEQLAEIDNRAQFK